MTSTITITHYALPNGTPMPMTFDIGEEHVEMAKDLILSCEILRDGSFVAWGRREDQDEDEEDLELANIAGDRVKALRTLIERLNEP